MRSAIFDIGLHPDSLRMDTGWHHRRNTDIRVVGHHYARPAAVWAIGPKSYKSWARGGPRTEIDNTLDDLRIDSGGPLGAGALAPTHMDFQRNRKCSSSLPYSEQGTGLWLRPM